MIGCTADEIQQGSGGKCAELPAARAWDDAAGPASLNKACLMLLLQCVEAVYHLRNRSRSRMVVHAMLVKSTAGQLLHWHACMAAWLQCKAHSWCVHCHAAVRRCPLCIHWVSCLFVK